MKEKETKPVNQKAGFLIDLLFGTDGTRKRQTKKTSSVLEASINSEGSLIKSYETLASASKKYYEDYNNHLENLITLDDINGMTGLQSTFKNIIVKNLFKGNDKVDQSSPILLKNYSVSENTTPKFFRKEHLISQIRYKLASFALKDTLLISQYDVSMADNKAIIQFKMINGDMHEKSVPIDTNFNMDLSKLQTDIRDIIKSMKKKMDYEIEIADDFELTDLDLEIPGLEFADPETALERKIKALQQKSVKVDSAVLATEKPVIKSAKKDEPVWVPFKQAQITPSVVKKASHKRRNNGISFTGDEKAGQLNKAKPDVEKELLELVDKKPEMPQPKEAEHTVQQKNNRKNKLREECEKNVTLEDCSKNPKCYFHPKAKKCIPSIRA